MKNLKRVLTVVLAVAMMFSLVAVASATTIVGGYDETAGSKAYADYDSIANKEAVDVLTELTVLDGFEDGNFHPEKNLTRAQMAKIIAYIKATPVLGTDLTLEKFKAAFGAYCDFQDVSADAWYAGVVGFDKHSGIVDGVDGKNFVPDRNVKIVEAAKMALVVLGYDADEAGLVGPDWAGNTLALGLVKGLFDGIDLENQSPFDYISRDDMAQLVYNMLLATMVGYIEVDDALIEIDQVNGLARIYGNNFNFWRNSDLFVGKQAIQYYFGKNIAFTTGIVVANGYTDLGLTEDQMGFQGSYDVSFGGLTATYDPAFETVIYIPAGTCIGTGYCIGAHNIHNANCPANTQAAQLLVVPIYSCYEEIGREVKLTNVGNIIDVATTDVIDQFTSMVVTANNQAEVVTATGYVNDNATIKQNINTIITGIFPCKDDQGYGASAVDHTSFEIPSIDGVSATFTRQVAFDPLYTTDPEVYNYPGLVHYNIDNNGDGIAEFSIVVEELLASPTQPNADLLSRDLKAIVDTDGVILHGEVPTARTVSLYHFGIAYNELNDQGTPKCVINDNLDMNTGFVTRWTGNYIANDYVYNHGLFDGVDYPISQLCTRELLPMNTKWELNCDMNYWLDHGGNIVRLAEIAAPAPIETLVYGITRSTHTYSDTEYQVYTIYTITKDGEKAEYDLIPEPAMDDELAAEIFDNTVANYCKLTFDRNMNVVALEDLSNIKDTSYTKGTLILGDIAQEYADIVSVLEANDVLFVGIDDVDAYVTDETVFFNFQKGKGAFEYYDWTDSLMNARNNWAMQQKKIKVGEVNISKVDAIADTTLGSTFLKHVDAREGVVTPEDYADYVILSFVNKYVPIKEIDTYPVDQTGATNDEFVYISLDDLSFVSQVTCEAVDANNAVDFLWKVPCTPDYLNGNYPDAEAGYVYILDSQLDIVSDAVLADGTGALFLAYNIPGYYNDELTVVDLSDEEVFVNGTIMSNSGLIERLAIADDEQAWNTAAPEASKIYRIENGAMVKITRADLKIGDEIAYIRSDLEGTAPVGVARGFADTIQIAFVGELPTTAPAVE